MAPKRFALGPKAKIEQKTLGVKKTIRKSQVPKLQPKPKQTSGEALVDPGPYRSLLMGKQLTCFPSIFTVASDCSGLCTEAVAVRLTFPLALKVFHKYASEICPEKRTDLFHSFSPKMCNCVLKILNKAKTKTCRKFIQRMFAPSVLADDMAKSFSNPPAFENADLYAIGFPCQPFSVAGARKALADPRGQVLKHIPRQIARNRPKSYLLENVAGFLAFPEIFNALLTSLRQLPGRAW